MRIPKSIVDRYFDEICFMVYTYFVYAWVVLPIIAWLRPMPYEVNVDANAKPFKTYDIVKNQMNMESSDPKIEIKRKNKSLEDKEDEEGESKHTTEAKEKS